MEISTRLLQATGYRAWELGATWSQDPGDSSDPNDHSECRREPAECEGGVRNPCDEPIGFPFHDAGPVPVEDEHGTPRERSSYVVGQFVFFLVNRAPFVMGKVIDTHHTDEKQLDEILVQHKFTPANQRVQERASIQSVARHGGLRPPRTFFKS